MNAIILAAGLLLGGIFTHLWEQGDVTQARGELATLKEQHSAQLVQERAAALARLQGAIDHANVIESALGDTQQRLSDTQKEVQREIALNTTGRACLNGRTVGLLNRAAADGTATVPGTASEPDTADGPAAADTDVATDTDIATWANYAIEQYNTCRARLRALIDWYVPEPRSNHSSNNQHDN